MSSRKVKPFTRILPVLSSTFATGETTFNTATHYLTTGDLVTIRFKNNPLFLTNVPVTVLSSTSFKVSTDRDYNIQESGEVIIDFYFTGQTGTQSAHSITHTTGLPFVIQSHVIGTGGAVYIIEKSLDGVHWIADASGTLTHTGTTNHTLGNELSGSWVYVRINITSIGAATKLYVYVSA